MAHLSDQWSARFNSGWVDALCDERFSVTLAFNSHSGRVECHDSGLLYPHCEVVRCVGSCGGLLAARRFSDTRCYFDGHVEQSRHVLCCTGKTLNPFTARLSTDTSQGLLFGRLLRHYLYCRRPRCRRNFAQESRHCIRVHIFAIHDYRIRRV
jgi:hypothetical protein